VESSHDAIIGMTSQGMITDWNAAASRIFEFSAADTIGKSIEIIVPQDLMGESAEVLSQIRDGEAIASFETIRVRKSGGLIDVSLTISPIRDEQGGIVGASAIARDITGLTTSRREREALLISEREARETAETANRVKDEFLAMLGHELRNPLQAISIGAYLLNDPENLETARGIISRQTEHISRIVDDLLDVARVSSGRIVLERHPLDLAVLVSDCVNTLRETGQLERHKIEVRLQSVWVTAISPV
jgi:PAS domain S-box-containing protein